MDIEYSEFPLFYNYFDKVRGVEDRKEGIGAYGKQAEEMGLGSHPAFLVSSLHKAHTLP